MPFGSTSQVAPAPQNNLPSLLPNSGSNLSSTGGSGNALTGTRDILMKDAKKKNSVHSLGSQHSRILKSSRTAATLHNASNTPSARGMSRHILSTRSGGSQNRFTAMDDDVFEPIKGPIHVQMPIQFFAFGCILLIAMLLGWIGDSPHEEMLLLYGVVCYFVFEISRLVLFIDQLSMTPMYLTYIPFSLIVIYSGSGDDAHLILSVVWYVSNMTIHMQSGSTKLRMHVLLSTVVFLVTYIVNIIFCKQGAISLSTGINSTTNALTYAEVPWGDFLVYMNRTANPKVDTATFNRFWGREGTFLISVLLIGTALYMLERFIKMYANTLVDRENHVQNLVAANAQLQKELRKIKTDFELDLDSPITKVIQILRSIQNSPEMDVDTVDNLDFVIQILSSNQLFSPDLNFADTVVDSEVTNWLQQMINNSNKAAPVGAPEVEGHMLTVRTEDPPASLNILNDTAVAEVLKKVEDWDFSVFDLARATQGRPLFYLGIAFFERYRFKETFNIDDRKLRSFLNKIEAGYKSGNPYHNSIHAADVTQTINYFIAAMGMQDFILMEEKFACIVAALIHDLDHQGFNNAFLISTGDPLAIRYNDKSVLENHHCARAFEWILGSEECNIFSTFTPEKYKVIRENTLSLVLATDMAHHFPYIAKFKNKINGSGFNFEDAKDRQLIMDIAIKCADISNPAKPRELSTKWAERIMEEFFLQGDEERNRGLPISMFMDRHNTNIAKCQIAFIDYIVGPLYEAWDSCMNEGGEHGCLRYISENREYWKGRLQEMEQLESVATDKGT